MNRRNKTYKLVVVAFFIALEIIFSRFLSINTSFIRIGFGFLPVSMVGIMYGPLWAGTAYAIGDLIGITIFHGQAPFIGFTISAFLTGLVFGAVLHKKEVTWKKTLIASAIVTLGINVILGTFWLTILMGDSFIALLPARLAKAILVMPVQAFLIPFIWNNVVKKIYQPNS